MVGASSHSSVGPEAIVTTKVLPPQALAMCRKLHILSVVAALPAWCIGYGCMRPDAPQRNHQNASPIMKKLLSIVVLAGAIITGAQAQTILSSNNQLLLPQFIVDGSTSGNRSPLVSYLGLTGLSASSTYRYFVGSTTNAATNPLSGTIPGNMVIINNGDVASYTTSKSFNNAGQYGEFTTDATGNYTGWFGLVPTSGGGGTVFAAGKTPYLYLQMSNTSLSGSSALLNIRALDAFTSLGNPGTAGTATLFYGSALFDGLSIGNERFFALWDNVAGTGRPLAASWTEFDNLVIGTGVDTLVGTNTGTFSTYIPTNAVVQRIEFFDGSGISLGFATNDLGFTGTATSGTGIANGLNIGEVALVPEPSTYALLALSGAGLAAYRLRRRTRR